MNENMSFKNIVMNLHDGLYLVDKDRIITYWNKAAERITGFTADEVIGKSCSDNILTHVNTDGISLCLGHCPLAASMEDGVVREAEVSLHHKNGHRVPVSVRTTVLRDDQDKIVGGVELFTDISHQKVNELRVKELEKLAMLDNLTQLANRNYLDREFESRFEEFNRLNTPFGILFMDIDHFKQFNDEHGHDVGDRVLKLVAATLTSNARPFDLFGRWGGEEFIGIIRNVEKSNLLIVGERIRMLVQNAYLMSGDIKLNVTISIGATLIRKDDTVDSLMKRADKQLYASKSAGRNCLSFE